MTWFASADELTLHLSVLTLGEVRSGITRMREPVRQAFLESSHANLRSRFRGRILDVDAAVAERWGRLTGELAMIGIKLPTIDALIAATALHHDLAVVTRNDSDFRAAGITVINPFT